MLEGLYIFTTKFLSKQKVSILYVKILVVLRPNYFLIYILLTIAYGHVKCLKY